MPSPPALISKAKPSGKQKGNTILSISSISTQVLTPGYPYPSFLAKEMDNLQSFLQVLFIDFTSQLSNQNILLRLQDHATWKPSFALYLIDY